jgi:hypothetical protein
MFHLDYLSCFLTVLATILLARKSWIGLLVAIINSLIVCAIGLRTSQLGFIPANLFCIGIYAFSMRSWLKKQPTQIEIRRGDRMLIRSRTPPAEPCHAASYRCWYSHRGHLRQFLGRRPSTRKEKCGRCVTFGTARTQTEALNGKEIGSALCNRRANST